MKVDIKGFREISLIEWDGKICSIIFLAGCNFKCPYCHSPSLVLNKQMGESIPFSYIRQFLLNKKDWVDGVVITGGEPTLNDYLFDLITQIKSLSKDVKLDTNGTNPDVIYELISKKMVDYIAMDIKTALLDDYKKATGTDFDVTRIRDSIRLIIDSKIDHEFRTTVVPGVVDRDDIISIAKLIKGCKRYVLQQFVPRDTLDPAFMEIKPYPLEVIEDMAALAGSLLENVSIRRN